jgi:Protein of unknown function (DUF2924)
MWREIEALRRATVGELRNRYLEVFGQPSHSNHKQYLFRRLAWRLQAQAYGEISEQARKRAAALAQDVDLRIKAPRHLVGAAQQIFQPTRLSRRERGRDERLPVPGTLLQREFKGTQVVVQVLGDGFQYQDRFYRSLTAIARQVTGTPWNGYEFFRSSLTANAGGGA